MAKIFEQIIAKSGLNPFEKVNNTGYWRILVVRESKITKQMLVSVVVSKGTAESMSEETKAEII